MPILHKGQHTCSQCKRTFEWIHFELTRQKLRAPLVVERIPTQPKIHRCIALENGKFEMGINCPHCDRYNRFIFVDDSISE